MEGQPFFTTIAGLSVSLAGFGAVIAWLRDDPSGWDPVNLWRVKTIVRHALTLAFLCLTLVPIHTFTGEDPLTIRIGSALVVLIGISDLWRVRRPDPVVWDPLSLKVYVTTGGLIGLTAVANLFWASLGVLLEIDQPAGELADAELRPLDVLHDRHGATHVGRSCPDPVVEPAMDLVATVGEVEPGDVHPRLDE